MIQLIHALNCTAPEVEQFTNCIICITMKNTEYYKLKEKVPSKMFVMTNLTTTLLPLHAENYTATNTLSNGEQVSNAQMQNSGLMMLPAEVMKKD